MKKYIPVPLYEATRKESDKFSETNDCAVTAISIALSVPYSVTHQTLQSVGRKFRCGTYRYQSMDAIVKLGYRIETWKSKEIKEEIICHYPEPHTLALRVTTYHPVRFGSTIGWEKVKELSKDDNIGIMIFMKGHVAAMKNGVIHDWSQKSSKWVHEIWILRKN